ncbi:aldo/keto reductase, partial [Nocardioides sp.]|uniref:aldo/keto reductase n=1 Tax=Nocardioides sp. TaxID=35761 RepID=UPI002D804451
MQQRTLGSTGLKVSRLGLGTLTWGRDTDEHEARDQLIAFAEAGGTLLDTAAGYGDGASEELIATLIGDVVARDEIVLATKAG